MLRVNIVLFCFLSLWVSASYANRPCAVITGSCPNIFQSSRYDFCCDKNGEQYCCDAEEYIQTTGAAVALPIILGALSMVVILICCACCVCCSCCPCYRKRERGAVYVPGPSTFVQVTQNPPSAGANTHGNNQKFQQAYPPQPGMPQSPPAYATDVYSKQSPYNPNYPAP